jgi:hypothetical protein
MSHIAFGGTAGRAHLGAEHSFFGSVITVSRWRQPQPRRYRRSNLFDHFGAV